MVRRTKKNKRGGDKLEDIQSQLNTIQEQVNELKNSKSETVVEAVSEPVVETMSEVISEKPISKTWVTDKEIKFKDGDGGRVSLAVGRVMSHIDNNIKKGSTTKDWTTIKEKLIGANSENEVQDVINQYKVKFASNYVLGGKTKRKGKRSKRRTHRRH